jgi:tetratricopeptide (TPR) repeat protein
MYYFLCIQIRHLQGYYEESIVRYKQLLEEMDLIRSTIPVHIYNMVAMKYADLLFLKGEFNLSLNEVEKLLAREDTPLIDQIELLRIKGHIYRFNKQYAQAKIIYETLLGQVINNGLIAYKGKLLNNMIEVTCMEQPEEAIHWYEKSLDENSKTGNDIEIGKSQAAVSTAYTMKGEFEKAIEMAKYALATAEKTGYQSGKAFALAALWFAQKCSKKNYLAVQTKNELTILINDIKVYQYLLKEIV